MQEFFLKKVAANDACAHPDHLKTRINFHGFLPWPPSEAFFVDLKARILSSQRRAEWTIWARGLMGLTHV